MVNIIFFILIIILFTYIHVQKIHNYAAELKLRRELKHANIKYNTLKDKNSYVNKGLYRMERRLHESDRQSSANKR